MLELEFLKGEQIALPNVIPNQVIGAPEVFDSFEKHSPATGRVLYRVVRSQSEVVNAAVLSAKRAQQDWGNVSSVKRGKILLQIARLMEAKQGALADVVVLETGKSPKEALGETSGAIQLAEFFAGEGMRLYGKSLQSGNPHKQTMIRREPLGVAGLIIAANTPIANIAWKVFPALICGNAVVLKAAEDAPGTAWFFAKVAHEAGLPPGLLNVIQGIGKECGEVLVKHPDVNVVSFTGSTAVGKRIARLTAEHLTRCSLELGGKNPLVVCEDADISNALKWSLLSSFSNAGQRCAASSRIIILESIYESFRDALITRTKALRLGPTDEDDLGAVINQRQMDHMLAEIAGAVSRGAKILVGGERLPRDGYYIAPTLIEGVGLDDPISQKELFGPVAVLYKAKTFADAIAMANHSQYGLTAAIHTRNIDRAMEFTRKVRAGAVNVNAGTYGSEPHYPFGGFGLSGNGTREPGEEALNVYSELKCVSFVSNELKS